MPRRALHFFYGEKSLATIHGDESTHTVLVVPQRRQTLKAVSVAVQALDAQFNRLGEEAEPERTPESIQLYHRLCEAVWRVN